MSEQIEDKPFHLDRELARGVLGREPAGRGGFGLAPIPPGWHPVTAQTAAAPLIFNPATPQTEEQRPGQKTVLVVTQEDLDGAVVAGQFVVDSAQPQGLAIATEDPTGGEWEGEESLGRCAQLLADFLASDALYLRLVSPIDGRAHLMTRSAAGRVALVSQAVFRMAQRPVRATDPGTKLVRPDRPSIVHL